MEDTKGLCVNKIQFKAIFKINGSWGGDLKKVHN